MKKFTSIASVLMMAAPSALATDYYVNAVNGNDANAGNTPTTAWKTITHAGSAAAAGSTSTIHLAPGTYDSASGETFPLVFNGQVLHGDGGSALTIIDAGGGTTLITMTQGPSAAHLLASIEGITTRNATTSFDIQNTWGPADIELHEIRMESLSTRGIFVSTPSAPAGASIHLLLDHVDFSAAHATNLLYAGSNGGGPQILANDCVFSNASGDAVILGAVHPASVVLTCDRCRFTDNAVGGIAQSSGLTGHVETVLRDCLIARNGRGFYHSDVDPTATSSATFIRSTVVDNLGTGIQNTGSGSTPTTITGTIVQGNGTDVQATGATISNSWITAGDPLFRDRAAGDYRLRFGSPCIDAGDPAAQVGTLDLEGVARPIDGNLDTSERADIGAFEFQPLVLVTSGHVGAPLRLEMAGQAGGTTTVYFSRAMPVSPMSTPFGEFDLNPASFGTLLHTGVAPFPPVAFQRPIPNNPFLVGHTFSFQALTTSSIAPQGSAYTNVVSFTVLP